MNPFFVFVYWPRRGPTQDRASHAVRVPAPTEAAARVLAESGMYGARDYVIREVFLGEDAFRVAYPRLRMGYAVKRDLARAGL